MNSKETRKIFLDFFNSKQHHIVSSAPMVIKNDPTLMFTNAGMNQFKDIFLGDAPANHKKIANTQKCLRVSGKHNDLEEVGIDTYHHTMFEMLGNWSFGDYFKKEAISWAWELLTKIYKLPIDRIYVTVFEGDEKEKLGFDQEAFNFWKEFIEESHILRGNKKDNFWEMGETGPCGPCSEIHIDLRDEAEIKKQNGDVLVNSGHPQVIEVWNLVFMEFNRKSDGSLHPLPQKHVDTGMGFERLCMALQGKKSNYDTDLFQPLIQYLAAKSKIQYGADEKTDIAMRVMSDHIRAIAFAIADGQLPSNNKAGYVIRRILRRAVRYAFTFLNFKEPALYELLPLLSNIFGDVFPELISQQDFIKKVIFEEEASFLRTLEQGIQKFDEYIHANASAKIVDGDFAFLLYDTYGFPIDLTELLAKENGLQVDMAGFNASLDRQKERSKAAAVVNAEDWVELKMEDQVEFVGYDSFSSEAEIIKYRKVKSRDKEQYQIVFNKTPFYAESGGQVGDTGTIRNAEKTWRIDDTRKENNLTIHLADQLPDNLNGAFTLEIDIPRRKEISANHSATHLLHAALKEVLGDHVNQKGSLVNDKQTRFDFSHFAKLSDDEINRIEWIVNQKIRENIRLEESRNVPVKQALEMGAMALFGEKYGEFVRVITFDKSFSVELCGGTHIPSTGQIGYFKILAESAVAAGVRRIEAVTSEGAQRFITDSLFELDRLKALMKNPKDIFKSMEGIIEENSMLKNRIQKLEDEQLKSSIPGLLKTAEEIHGVHFIAAKLDVNSADALKTISFEMKKEMGDLFLVLGAVIDQKVHISVMLSENLIKEPQMHAVNIIKKMASEIQGGGGGQAFFATAGGKNPAGLSNAFAIAKDILLQSLS